MATISPISNYSNEKFSFSLAIVVTLILCASASFDYLKTNSIFLSRFLVPIQLQKHQSNTKHESSDTKTIEYFLEEGTKLFYLYVIPTVITTLLMAAFLFTFQIILRGIWFYVYEVETEDRYAEAAARLDKWANFVYGMSFIQLILNLVFIINLLLWLGLGFLTWRYGLESELEHIVMPSAFVWTLVYLGRHVIRTFRLNIHFWKKVISIGLVLSLVGFAGWVLYQWNTTIIFGLILYLGVMAALFLWSFYLLIRCIDNQTGVLCLMRRHSSPFAGRALLGRRLAIAVSMLLLGTLFVWCNNMIVKTASTLEMHLDKHVYRPGEIAVITLNRSGLIQGPPSITVVQGNNSRIKLEPVSYNSGDTIITYFLPINSKQNDSGNGPRVWRLKVSQFKVDYFERRYLEVVDYLAILPAS